MPAKLFWRVGNYLRQDASFAIGYAAGIFDGVSLMAAALDGADVDTRVRGLYECLDSKGDTLGELRAWI